MPELVLKLTLLLIMFLESLKELKFEILNLVRK